jgi:hypothetical protein
VREIQQDKQLEGTAPHSCEGSGPDVPAAEHFHGHHFLGTVSTTSIRRTMGYSGTNQDEQFTGSSDCRYYITSLTAFCARRLPVLFKKKAQIAEVKGLGD